jgi:hypothetical protein
VEADVGGLLTEALTADVQAVLADETGLVGADTAVEGTNVSFPSSCIAIPIASNDPPNCAFPPNPIPAQRGVRTIHGCPCRRCAGASTRQTRGTC